MAGYSETPLPRKLGIKEGARVAFPGAPSGFDTILGELPHRVVIKRRAVRPLNVVVAFFTSRVALERRFEALAGSKVCAIDEVWSGLRVVWRLENRARS